MVNAGQKRSSEVWEILAPSRRSPGVLEKVKRQLNTASRTIAETDGTRAMARKRPRSYLRKKPLKVCRIDLDDGRQDLSRGEILKVIAFLE